MLQLVCFLICVALSIILGTKTKINIGIWALVCAMLLSILFLGNTASKTLQTHFPVKVLPVSMCCMLFFGTLSSTGTITVLTHKIARKIKGSKAAVAVFVVYFSTLIVNFCIGSSNAILYAMTPFAVGLMIELGLNPTMGALAVWAGFNSSGFLPWENQGIINGGLANTSFGEPVGNLTLWNATGLLNVFFILMLIGVLIVSARKDYSQFKGAVINKGDEEQYEFSDNQKKVLVVLACVMTVIILPQLLTVLLKKVPAAKEPLAFIKRFDVAFCFTAGSLVIFLLKCADATDVIMRRMPWRTVMLLYGTCVLFGLAQPLGIVDLLVDGASKLPAFLIAPALAFICAFLSMFVSGAVLSPLFIPLCGALATAAGVSIPFMCAMAVAGGSVSCCSPASAAGAMCVSTIGDDAVSRHVSGGMAKVAVANMILFPVFACIAQLFF